MTQPQDPIDQSEDPGRFKALRRVAVDAEMATGDHETSLPDARRNVFFRFAIIGGGSLVLLTGLILIVIPGPGLVVTAAGLAILATEVPFAARMLERVRERLPSDADGKLPKSAIVTMVVMGGGAFCLSLWWAFRR